MKKAANAVDRHVGSRVRMRRMMLGLSQEKLGDALDLTFQQVQKYEKGMNRIGASRLQQLSTILKVPVAFFFEGAPGSTAISLPDSDMLLFQEFVGTSDGLAMMRGILALDPAVRRRIVALVNEIVDKAEEAEAEAEAA